ncbi:MAG: hypothetical protein IJT42_04190 [Treponema sp.]|nr:hypothetical protein [Treponema sp.]
MNEITMQKADSLSALPERLSLAQSDRGELSSLIRDYTPFIKKCVTAVMFGSQSKEDCLTEAMLAFAHSVQTYKEEFGSFVAYARTVIKNRLIDSARSELAYKNHIHYEDGSDDEGGLPSWDSDMAIAAFNRQEEEKNLALEIEALNEEFEKWGFSWASLQKKCPKQERSRRICQQIAHAVLSSPALLSETLSKKQLPAARLGETFPKKALEKYRIYIIALILIQKGEYPYVYSFVPQYSLSDSREEK